MLKKRAQVAKLTANSGNTPTELPTFLEHVYELRRRLFWIVAVILLASAAAYPFLDTVLGVLTAPLAGQQLYYLTPVGGLSFSIKICFYIGILVAVPFVMFHLYRYIEPLMGQRFRRSSLFYVGLSTLLAVAGILFAYYISLPGALHFLTGMDLTNIQAMLTVDAYLTFVMTYLLGAAILFQIPLLLLIINTMTPLKPGTLMKIQRYVVVGAFIIAAIISPTPDILNQLLFALPIIVMYEIGVVLVWLQNRARARRQRKEQEIELPVVAPKVVMPVAALPVVAKQLPVAAVQKQVAPAPRRVVAMDGFVMRQKPQISQPVIQKIKPVPVRRQVAAPSKPLIRPAPKGIAPAPARHKLTVPRRSVDGFMPYRPQHAANPS